MTLAKRLLNERLLALTVPEELADMAVVINGTHRVTLRRTFNQKLPNGAVIKFWRVTGPIGHRNYESDLSLEGLKEWGII